jgi:uncharacterized protein
MLDISHLAMLAGAVLATSLLSGIFGMAGGMILMGFLLAIMPLAAAMALHGITQMTSNGWRAWLWREHIHWRIVVRHAAGSLVALIAFMLLAVRPTTAEALLILGLTPFIGLLLPPGARLNAARPTHGLACGAVCMGLQLLAGVSGPILDTFYVHSGLDRRCIVATKAAVQTLGHALRLTYFGAMLALHGGEVAPVVVTIAVGSALLGTHASRRVLELVSNAQFQKWSRWLIAAIALIYLWQGGVLFMHEARQTVTQCAAAACSLEQPSY